MMIGAAGMGLCMAVIAGCVSQTTNKASLGVATAFVYLFSPFFVTGFLGLAFLYSSEIVPLSVRTPITALSKCSTWVFNFVVAEITPVGFTNLGYKYFIIYACINLCLILPSKSSSPHYFHVAILISEQPSTSPSPRPSAGISKRSTRSSWRATTSCSQCVWPTDRDRWTSERSRMTKRPMARLLWSIVVICR